MTYEQCLDAIHSRGRFSVQPSLDRIARLMDRLGNPQDSYPCVHVAGTNGKGSVCALTEAALRQSGLRVGLFTSPYLLDFRERIQIDRQMLSREEVHSCYEIVMREEQALEREGREPVNEFELVTAMGFVAFARAKVDYAVIEVGLGGRWDATNVISAPKVCCITAVSQDHTAVLGDTTAQIAAEKAGIIKPGCPVVMAPQEESAARVIRARAGALHSPLTQTGQGTPLHYGLDGLRFRYGDTTISVPLLGRYQMDNAAAAWETCMLLGLSPEKVLLAFQRVSWPGRQQYIPGSVSYLVDAGHNPSGIEELCHTLDTLLPERRILTVMAMMRDKDYRRCVPMVARRSHCLIASAVPVPRCLDSQALRDTAGELCPTCLSGSIEEGIALAREMAGPGDVILVCGSVYAAGAALSVL